MKRSMVLSLFILLAFMLSVPTLLNAAGNYPQPTICDRTCWSARAPQCTISQEPALTRAVIHHTAIASDFNTTSLEESKVKVRAIQNYHMDTNGWCDIGYHFLCDKLGNTFEGREGSITSYPRGAHDGVNTQSMGFNCMGYFHDPYNQEPTCEQRYALYDVIAWKMPDPFDAFGSGAYGSKSDVGYVCGHRDVVATACPGDYLYAYIGTDFYGGEARLAINSRITTGSGGPICDSTTPTPTPTPTPPSTEIIIDNPQASFAGAWSTGTSSTDKYGTDYRYNGPGTGAEYAEYRPNVPGGSTEVYAWWPQGTNRTTAAEFRITHSTGTDVVYKNQQIDGGKWNLLGTYEFSVGTGNYVRITDNFTGTYVVMADAVRFVCLEGGTTPTPTPTPTPATHEWRSFWVDAWHVGIKNATEVTTMVNTAITYNYNALVPQIRRRGDAYYFPTYPNTEPRATDIASDYDALQETINQAHAQGLEVHAWIPTFLIWSSTTPPSSPDHVYNAHPEYLMKNSSGQTYISEGYYLDPGNPDANKWNYNVVMDLVQNYNIDGIHFDYIRYPQQDAGYNDVAIQRYNAEYGLTGQPSYTDAQFSTWRRRQITDWLRNTYADIIAVKPSMKVTASVFASRSDAYTYRFQDWALWMQENLLDALMPMNYTTDNGIFNSRTDDAVANKYNRHLYMGNGAYLISKENTITQLAYARSKYCEGLLHYSYISTNSTGDSNAVFYQYIKDNLFQSAMDVPDMPWKSSPAGGYLRGKVTDNSSGLPIYNATVTIVELSKSIKTDGEGKYAFIYTQPGSYTVTCAATGYDTIQQPSVSITVGGVTTLDFQMGTGPTPTPTPEPTATPTPTPSPTPTPTPEPTPTPSGKVYVFDIAMTPIIAGKNYSARATVTIYNDSGAPVSGATVYGSWSGVVSGSSSGVTLSDGKISLTSPKTKQSGTFTFTVTDVTAAGYTYDPALNNETSDSIVVP